MFDLAKGGAGVTSPVKPDPWNMGGQNLREVSTTPDIKFNKKGFETLAQMQPPQAQFSPVEMGGAGSGQTLSAFITALLKGTGGQ